MLNKCITKHSILAVSAMTAASFAALDWKRIDALSRVLRAGEMTFQKMMEDWGK